MGSEYKKCFTAKVAELRKTDLRVDWSEIRSPNVPRRIALLLSELITEPVEKVSRVPRSETCAAKMSGV
jgi:hypothetical protein